MAGVAELYLVFGSGCDRGKPTAALTTEFRCSAIPGTPFHRELEEGTLRIGSVPRKNAIQKRNLTNLRGRWKVHVALSGLSAVGESKEFIGDGDVLFDLSSERGALCSEL